MGIAPTQKKTRESQPDRAIAGSSEHHHPSLEGERVYV